MPKTSMQEFMEKMPDASEIKQFISENDADEKMLDNWLWERLYKGQDWTEKEKQQIIDAANWDSKSISENGYEKGEQYYNETYKP